MINPIFVIKFHPYANILRNIHFEFFSGNILLPVNISCTAIYNLHTSMEKKHLPMCDVKFYWGW